MPAGDLTLPTDNGRLQLTHSGFVGANWGVSEENYVTVDKSRCPSCHMPILELNVIENGDHSTRLAFPFVPNRKAPTEVPPGIAKDFNEAAMILAFSENASAALSRRCLEKVLINKGFKQFKLSDKVKEACKNIPEDLRVQLDAVREIGNFGAHPIKDESTGTIVDVEPGEAEYILSILEQLFEYYYVRTAKSKPKIDKLNEKLIKMGRKPLQA